MKNYILGFLILLLIVLLAVFGWGIWNQYGVIKHTPITDAMNHRHGPLTIADVTYIQPWMTFEYIDFAYKLPPTYLQTSLNITNSQYPRISIRQYASDSQLDATFLTQKIISLVQTYLSGTGSSSVSTY